MKNKTNSAKRFQTPIRTQHVFNEGEQIFLKKESQEKSLEDLQVAEWFPTDFKWEPARL